jgi:SPP1 family predicted phage head-tail adaptor
MPTNYKDPLLLPAGALRHVVTILQSTLTTDLSGVVTTWTPFVSDIRAKIEPMRGLELLRSGQDATNNYITVTIRYVPGIQAAMRVKAHDATYLIQNIENVLERNRVLKLMCLGLGENA